MSKFDMSLPSDARSASNIKQVLTPGITEEERNQRYDSYSKTYDEDSLNIEYVAPHIAAEALTALVPEEDRKTANILDIGAGTGLVGEAMKKFGFEIMDALEPSTGMLKLAMEKAVYRKYICDAIGSKPLGIPDNSYDIVTVVGSHGHNHIKSEALYEMIRLVKTGGFVCIVTRMEIFTTVQEYKDSLPPLCQKLERDGKWRQVVFSPCPYLRDIQGVKTIYQICK